MDDFFDLSLDDLIKKYRIICEDEAKKLQLYDDDSSEQFTAVEKYNISSTRDDDDNRWDLQTLISRSRVLDNAMIIGNQTNTKLTK